MWFRFLDWLESNWLSTHLAFIPIGTWGATWLLVDITGAGSNWWAEWEALRNVGQAAPFGAATYGAFMLPLEAGVRVMFWAISQFVKDLKEMKRQEEEEQKIREQQREEELRIREQQRDEELLKQAEATGLITLAGNVQLRVTRVESPQEESSPDEADTRC